MKPVLFTLPGLGWQIQAYGFFVALALVVGWLVTLQLARRDALGAPRLGPVFVVSSAAGVVGARAAWVVQHPDTFAGAASLVTLRAGTLAPFAGVVIALVVGGAWVSRYRIPVWAWYDVLAPACALGVVFERIGAFFAGTGYGRYAPDAALSIRFPIGSPAFVEHRRALASLMKTGATESLAVHPTQLYAVVLGLGGLALCAWLRRRRRFSGQIFLGFSIYYLAVRSFGEEFLRADAPAAVLGPLSGGQIGAAAMMGVLGVVYAVLGRRADAGDVSVRGWEGGRWSIQPPGSGRESAGSGKRGPVRSKSKARGKPKGKGKRA